MSKWLAAGGFLLLTLACPTPSTAGKVEEIAGDWTGVVVIRPAEHEVDFMLKIQRQEDGVLRGWVSYPSQGIKDHPLESVAGGADGRVTFSAKDEKGVVSAFEGWLSEDRQSMDGVLAESGEHYAFSLHRKSLSGPRPVHELKTLSSDGTELISAFNEDRSRVRLLLILAPSCPMCLNSVGVVHRYVLEKIQDPSLRVYVVWEAVSPSDDRSKAEVASALIADPRVQQFWSASRFTGTAFQRQVGIKDVPAWDVCLLFSAGKSWQADPPTFDSFMHNLLGREELPKDRRLNGAVLAGEVRALLEKQGSAKTESRGLTGR